MTRILIRLTQHIWTITLLLFVYFFSVVVKQNLGDTVNPLD